MVTKDPYITEPYSFVVIIAIVVLIFWYIHRNGKLKKQVIVVKN